MRPLRLRWTGALAGLDPGMRRELLDRGSSEDEGLRLTVSSILEAVQRDGDDALRALAREFDGVSALTIEVPRREWRRALEQIDGKLRDAMERTIERLRIVHRAFAPAASEIEVSPGIVVGRRADPLDRVGVYAPGGRAPYPSSLLMGAIPARVAGVREVIVCSPPGANGAVPEIILAAAELAGVDALFALGGAGAIAAMAFGTATVPRVDRIVGPGNAYTTEAKAQVARTTGIDLLAGPSELLVIADSGADMAAIAREMLAQAEHDPLATSLGVLVDDDGSTLLTELSARLHSYDRRDVIHEALARRGGILSAATVDEAVRFANAFAPEHLLLMTADPGQVLPLVRNAGTVFIGAASSVSFGDYATGSNHVLPTGGLARSSSGLSTEHFVRWTTYQRVAASAARELADDVERFALAERLDGHARAAAAWGAP